MNVDFLALRTEMDSGVGYFAAEGAGARDSGKAGKEGRSSQGEDAHMNKENFESFIFVGQEASAGDIDADRRGQEIVRSWTLLEAEGNSEWTLVERDQGVSWKALGTCMEEMRIECDGSPTWYSNPGQGPTLLGRVRSSLATVTELAIGTLAPHACQVEAEDAAEGMRTKFVNAGTQLSGGDVYKFIEGLKMPGSKHAVNHLCCFYVALNCNINGKTLEAVKQEIEMSASFFDPKLPIVIPVTFAGEGLWERNHIAVILIKDGCVEYYDPKGILSRNRRLADEHTLRNVLECCRDAFCPGGLIMENPYMHQLDCHKCGVYVCHFLHERLVGKTVVGTLLPEAPNGEAILNRRFDIVRIADAADRRTELMLRTGEYAL